MDVCNLWEFVIFVILVSVPSAQKAKTESESECVKVNDCQTEFVFTWNLVV